MLKASDTDANHSRKSALQFQPQFQYRDTLTKRQLPRRAKKTGKIKINPKRLKPETSRRTFDWC